MEITRDALIDPALQSTFPKTSSKSTQINSFESDGRSIYGEIIHPNLNKFFKDI